MNGQVDPQEHPDILAQPPGLNIYTQICLFFPLGTALVSDIIGTLTRGLERLFASFPWINRRVVDEGTGDGSTGTYKAIPFESPSRLIVKVLREESAHDGLSIEALKLASFPMSMLDESALAPRKILPSAEEPASRPAFLV